MCCTPLTSGPSTCLHNLRFYWTCKTVVGHPVTPKPWGWHKRWSTTPSGPALSSKKVGSTLDLGVSGRVGTPVYSGEERPLKTEQPPTGGFHRGGGRSGHLELKNSRTGVQDSCVKLFRLPPPPGMPRISGSKRTQPAPTKFSHGNFMSVSRSLLGAKRTCPFALHMSASDPKRTSRLVAQREIPLT